MVILTSTCNMSLIDSDSFLPTKTITWVTTITAAKPRAAFNAKSPSISCLPNSPKPIIPTAINANIPIIYNNGTITVLRPVKDFLALSKITPTRIITANTTPIPINPTIIFHNEFSLSIIAPATPAIKIAKHITTNIATINNRLIAI